MEKSAAAQGGTQCRKTLVRGLIFIPLFLFLMFLLAVLLERELLQQGREAVWCAALLFVTAVIGGWQSAKHAEQKKLLFGLLGDADLAVFLLFLGVFTKSSSVINISVLTDILALLFGALIGSFLSSTGKKRRKKHR